MTSRSPSTTGTRWLGCMGSPTSFSVTTVPSRCACDDSVARVMGGAPPSCGARGAMCRSRSRCHGARVGPILAVGAELKNVFALVRDRDVFLSPHLGDLGDERRIARRGRSGRHFERLLELEPDVVAHDLHPGYRSTAYAISRAGVDRVGRAAPSRAHRELSRGQRGGSAVIGVAWDGTGYGPDGSVWGGEFLVGRSRGFERVGHLSACRCRGARPRSASPGAWPRSFCAPRTVRHGGARPRLRAPAGPRRMAHSHGGHRGWSERAADVERGAAVRCGGEPARASRHRRVRGAGRHGAGGVRRRASPTPLPDGVLVEHDSSSCAPRN